MNNTKFQHFFVAPNEIFDFEKSQLSVYAKIVYLYICRCENNSKAFPSLITIAEKCSIAKSTAQKAIDDLVAVGLIVKSSGVNKGKHGKNASNTYITKDASKISVPCDGTGSVPQDGMYKRTKKSFKKELPYIYLITDNEGYVFKYYALKYKEKFNREHPTMTKEKLDELNKNYLYLDSELVPNDDTWEELVDYHFKYLIPTNDGNILAFLSLNGGHGPVGRYMEDLDDLYD